MASQKATQSSRVDNGAYPFVIWSDTGIVHCVTGSVAAESVWLWKMLSEVNRWVTVHRISRSVGQLKKTKKIMLPNVQCKVLFLFFHCLSLSLSFFASISLASQAKCSHLTVLIVGVLLVDLLPCKSAVLCHSSH